ncbi:hypothetical protein [Pyxidicoccus sp. MSG2]|uniref:hypothetical protein n=1 Tax=Pyxidicoccus sp. MSG2 TaxID=2996790 RepID=UPI002271AA29|nr:hypothetical protein [Pyxidicoccus sp. MSG2]MCY1023981.1 hypothetical protein [Pyxidicoccus sp. MSG2]
MLVRGTRSGEVAEVLETDDATVECAYCAADVPARDAAAVPPKDEDEAWVKLRNVHHRGCEWVATRAHRL